MGGLGDGLVLWSSKTRLAIDTIDMPTSVSTTPAERGHDALGHRVKHEYRGILLTELCIASVTWTVQGIWGTHDQPV